MQSFYQNWGTYKSGFGALETDYWIGLDLLVSLTRLRPYRALFNLTNATGTFQASYATFRVGNESAKFKLDVDGYSGNAGDAMASVANMAFSTKGRDHDKKWRGSCARLFRCGWWFKSCGPAVLNGPCPNQNGYYPRTRKYMRWKPTAWFRPLKASEFLISPA